MDEKKGAKKTVGAKMVFGDGEKFDKGSKKVVEMEGRKQPIMVTKKDKEKDKDKMSKGKDKDKDKDKLKKDKDKSKSWKKLPKKLSRSARAGLAFPVGRIHRGMKQYITCRNRVSGTTAVYLGSVMEYLSAEVLELAGNAAKEANQKRLTPRHFQLAIRGDDELNSLIKATIAGGGVVPHIEPELTKKNKKYKTVSASGTEYG